MIKDRKRAPRRTRQAADFFVRLSSVPVEQEDLEAFSAWRRADPKNRAAYEQLEDISATMSALSGDQDLREAAAEALARGPEVVALTTRRSSLGVRAVIGAAVAACFVAGLTSAIVLRQPTYSTRVGETFSARLDDGSLVQLNTDSKVRVRYSRGERRIELLQGQAFFDVAHNPARPFIVAAADTEVRAVGTRFEVRRSGEQVQVTLAQGSVEVTDHDAPKASWRLAPGQALAIEAKAPARARPVRVDVANATSWTTGKLKFQEVILSEAVAEMNRYSKEKIILGAGVPGDRRITGVFPAGQNGDFLAAASSLFGLTPVRRPNGDIELQPKVATPS